MISRTTTQARSTTMTHEPRTPISKAVEQSQDDDVEGHRMLFGTAEATA